MNKETREYIRLCNNSLIQEGWKPKPRDEYYDKVVEEVKFVTYQQFCSNERITDLKESGDYIFLPSLEQILEAMGERFENLECIIFQETYQCVAEKLGGEIVKDGISRRIAAIKALLEIRKEKMRCPNCGEWLIFYT